MAQIYKNLLEFRKINYYGLRPPLNFRHNQVVPYSFNKDQKTLLYVWNRICNHVVTNRKHPRTLDDDVIRDLFVHKLTPEICDVTRSSMYLYLPQLQELNLLLKVHRGYIVNPWYCNNLTQTAKEYVIEQLKVEVLEPQSFQTLEQIVLPAL